MNKHQPSTWAENMQQLENHYFVGRDTELKAIENWYTHTHKTTPILNLFGPAGCGKTLLLQQSRNRALNDGFVFHVLDCRTLLNVADMEYELQKLDLKDQSSSRSTIVCFDHFEESGLWESWLRETWIPSLSTHILLIFSSRSELRGPWKLHPTWKYLVHTLSVANLDLAAVEQFAARHGLIDLSQAHGLWIMSKGHPLTMSLAVEWLLASGAKASVFTSTGWQDIFSEWLREVPDEATRDLLEAASVLRFFDQSKLEFMLKQPISRSAFESLLRLSLVGRGKDGWSIHNPVRDALRLSFRARNPDLFKKLEQQAALFYKNEILHTTSEYRLSNPLGDLFYHTGNPVIRAHYHCSRTSANTLIQVSNDKYLQDLFVYFRSRNQSARRQSILCGENDYGHRFKYQLTREESLSSILAEDEAKELLEIGADVKLLMDEIGKTIGCCASIPITAATRSYLQFNRHSSAYFAKLSDEEWHSLLKAKGWFIRTVDIENAEDETLRHDSFRIKLSFIQEGSVTFYCPPPHPFYRDALLNLGFSAVDSSLQAPFYVLDLRGKKYREFISSLVPGEVMDRQPRNQSHVKEFTLKEAEVAELLIQGLSNAEIAKQLYVSVITVKKHLSSIYRKWDVRNRAQFMTKWMERLQSSS